MDESLEVSSFMVLRRASIEVKRINVLIGRQANGKSLIAKLVYFFRRIPNQFFDAIKDQHSKREFDKSILRDFEGRFPRYAWEGSSFELKYQSGGIEILIRGLKGASGKTNLNIEYSDSLVKLFNSKKRAYAKRLEEYSLDEHPRRRLTNYQAQVMYEAVVDPIKQGEHGRFFSSSVFVPASRSFFANLQKNIFTFMASNLDIDPFLKEFGSLYETSKRYYRAAYFPREPDHLAEELDRSIESIIAGKYEFDDDQDWIATKGSRVNLVNASSGQQEALPMLLTLAIWPFIRGDSDGSLFFIEEPEAHLFPTSQSRIVSMLTALYANLNVGFFVTTHSPYILSSLNNNILAGDVKSKGRINDSEFIELSGGGYPVSFEDVAAYTISNGIAKSISDPEFRMIGAEVLDEVSDHFQEVMHTLLQRDGATN